MKLIFYQNGLNLKVLCRHCLLFKNGIAVFSSLLYNVLFRCLEFFFDVCVEFSGGSTEAGVYLALEVSPHKVVRSRKIRPDRPPSFKPFRDMIAVLFWSNSVLVTILGPTVIINQ
jgi:hypothetical protein